MRIICICILMTSLIGCSSGGNASAGATNGNSNSQPSQSETYLVNGVDISNKSENLSLKGLPPAPDKTLNDSTVAGIDSDNDGVRDDVQRYIAVKYAGSARQRAGALQMARSLQTDLAKPPTTISAAISNNREIMRAMACLSDYVETGIIVPEISRDIMDRTLNTVLRFQSDNNISDLLAGQVVASYPYRSPGLCDSNMEGLPN